MENHISEEGSQKQLAFETLEKDGVSCTFRNDEEAEYIWVSDLGEITKANISVVKKILDTLSKTHKKRVEGKVDALRFDKGDYYNLEEVCADFTRKVTYNIGHGTFEYYPIK